MRSLRFGVTAVAAIFGLLLPANRAGAQEGLPTCNPDALFNSAGSPLVPIESRLISLPGVGVENSAEVGQSMLLTGNLNIYALGLTLKKRFVASDGKGLSIEIPSGGLLFYGASGGYGYYVAVQATAVSNGQPQQNPTIGLAVPADPARPWKVFVYGRDRYEFETPMDEADADLQYCATTDLSGVQRELVYSGGSRGTVSLLYREYSGDAAMPGYTQQLTYDLSAGDEIGFRGARIKILAVNNIEVRYVVERGFEGATN